MGGERAIATIADLLAGGGTIKTGPFGTTLKASEYSSVGVPLISVGEIGYGTFRIHEKTPRVSPAVTTRLAEYVLQEGDIVFGRKGAVDRSARISAEQHGWFLGSDGIRLRLPETTDSRFMAFQLQSPASRNWLLQHATGTTMASLNQDVIGRIPISLPPLPEQRAIARILGALDDKIELNRKMNATLETMARALFKSWFVDFDPVRAKAEGQAPSGMDAETARLFPSEFVESELGDIPRGWSVASIGNLAEIVGGSTPSTKESAYWDDGVHHWATPKDLSALATPVVAATERKITDEGLRQISSGLLPVGTVLLSSRAPIGYLGIADVPLAVNQGFIAMKPQPGISAQFLLRWAEAAHEKIVSRANGSTFLEISKSNFRPIQLVRPSAPVLDAFHALADGLYRRLVTNEQQSRSLAVTRDELLPRLLSGTLDVGPLVDRQGAADD
ncbi:restriction endonuclease subunit S [Myxococcota bacterium]|nr:restriction endonuclease subunit S [Myxococcota bacterium]